MGLQAVMCFRTFEPLSELELSLLNAALQSNPDATPAAPVNKIDPSSSAIDIYTGNQAPSDQIRLPVNENWYRASLVGPYSGPGYEKPGALEYIKIAELILSKVPEAHIYYGDDEHALTPFTRRQREELRQWADKVTRQS